MQKFIFFKFVALVFFVQTLNAFPINVLDGLYYENPAMLSRVKHWEFILGDDYVDLELRFKGISNGERGTARSHTHDHLPYGQVAYRLNDKFVIALAYLQNYQYVDIKWPRDSIVRFASTETTINSYRIATRLSYQLTKKLAVGFALDFQRRYNFQLNFTAPNLGNITNRSLQPKIFLGIDFGFFYALCPDTFLNAAIYTCKTHIKEHGISKSESGLETNRYSIVDFNPPVECYAQIIKNLNEKWLVSGKVNFSNWSVGKKLALKNTVVGDVTIPTFFRDVWTFEGATQFKLNSKWMLIGAGQYITNFSPEKYNVVGFPGSNVVVGIGGVGMQINECLGLQFLYVHAMYCPKSKINGTNDTFGKVSLNNNVFSLKITYSW